MAGVAALGRGLAGRPGLDVQTCLEVTHDYQQRCWSSRSGPLCLLADASLEPRPLPSVGITRLPRYYGPLRHPVGPNCPSRVPVGRVRATDRASRVASAPPGVHAVANTPAEPTGHFRSSPLAVLIAGSLPREPGGATSALKLSSLLGVHSRYGLHAR